MAKKQSQNKKILIIEDEEAMRKSLVFGFKKSKLEVLEAKNGEQGLRQAFTEHPDLILLDLLMPEKDGFVVLEELRQDKWGKDVPVIILTNLSGSEYVADTIQYGVFDHLVKSDWTIDDVVKIVMKKLAK